MTNKLKGIKKAEKFLWNEEIGRDFVELKRAFTKGGIQAFPDFGVGDPFILTTDWSKENIEKSFPSPGRTGKIPWMLGKKV